MTFNKGGTWQRVQPPLYDKDGFPEECYLVSVCGVWRVWRLCRICRNCRICRLCRICGTVDYVGTVEWKQISVENRLIWCIPGIVLLWSFFSELWEYAHISKLFSNVCSGRKKFWVFGLQLSLSPSRSVLCISPLCLASSIPTQNTPPSSRRRTRPVISSLQVSVVTPPRIILTQRGGLELMQSFKHELRIIYSLNREARFSLGTHSFTTSWPSNFRAMQLYYNFSCRHKPSPVIIYTTFNTQYITRTASHAGL